VFELELLSITQRDEKRVQMAFTAAPVRPQEE